MRDSRQPEAPKNLVSTEGSVNVTPREATPFAVTLSVPALAGGVTVTLNSSDDSKVIVTPASVFIPEGATTPTTQPQVSGIGIGSVTITGAATGYTPGAGVVIVPAPTMAFSGSPLVIAVGGSGSLTLSLTNGRAPAGGLTVSLSSSNASNATVPGTLSFAAGSTSVAVPVAGVAPGSVTITASAPNIANANASVTVTPPPTVTASYGANFLQVINVVLTNTSGVTAVNLRITSVTNITADAPNVIALSSNATFPLLYGTVPGGQAAVNGTFFDATAGSIEIPFSFTVAYQADNMPPQTAVISVPFPRAMNFSGSPLAINAGAVGNLTLNLTGNQAPAGGLTANLSSNDPSRATVPATVSFPPSATSVMVPVTGIAGGAAVITAQATVVNFPVTATAAVNVTGTLAIIVASNTPGKLGQTTAFAITLSAPAPVGGLTVTLISSDTSMVIVTPASVVIPQGATTPTTQPQVTGAGIGSATITAAATGYQPGTGTVTISAPTMAFSGSPFAIPAGGSGNLALILTAGQAPAGGLPVSLTSSDPGKAAVPKTVSFAAGATSLTVPVTGVAAGSATITASAPNIANAAATVNVNPPTVTISYFGPNNSSLAQTNLVLTNTSSVIAVNLRITNITVVSAAPPNVIVFDRTVASNPNFPLLGLNLAGGARIGPLSFGFRATAGSLSVPFSFIVAYQADNMEPQTAVIDVPFPRLISFSGSPLAINAGASGNLVLDLGGPALAGGLKVDLSSSDASKATVPTTVSVASGATSVTVPVTGIAPGSAAITANATVVGFAVTATATVNVLVAPAIGAPANTSVGLGQSGEFPVTVSAPAPAGGVIVNLSSSNPARVIVLAGVVIPPGATTPTTQPQVTGVGIGSATVTAAATGYKSGTGTVTISAPTMAFPGSPFAIPAGGSGNLTLNLTGGQAPAGGLTVSLGSSDTSKATVPATVSFTAGVISVIVPVTGVAPGSATITASAPNVANAAASVTVTPPPTVTASYGGQSFDVVLTNTSGVIAVNLRITSITNVTAAAPNAIVFDQSLVGNPNFVFPMVYGNLMGGGVAARTFGFRATAGSINVPFNFTITYQADNMPPQTAVIGVPVLRKMSFSGSPLTISPGVSGNLTLNVTAGVVPPGGAAINLSSSDPSKATVTATVKLAAGATSVAVPVTGIAPGSAVITASVTGIPNATATVNVGGTP